MLKSPHSQRTEKEPRAQHELPARSPLRPPRPTRPVTQDVILDEWSPEWKATIPAPSKPAVTHPHPHRPLRHPPQLLPERRSRIETSQNGTASNSSTATANGSASSKTSTSTPKPTSRSSQQSKKASSNATSHSSHSPS